MSATATAFDVAAVSALPLDAALGDCRDLLEDPSFPTVHAWKESGRQGPRPLPGLLPRGDRARGRHAAGQGARRAGRDAAGRLALRLVPLLDPQDLARAGARRPAPARPVRHPPDLRRGAQPGRRLGPQPPLPGADPLPAAERQLRRHRRLPARRVRARSCGDIEEVAGPRASTDDDLRRSIAVFNENRRLLRELYAIKRETPWLLAGGRGLRARRARRPAPARGAQRAPPRARCRRSARARPGRRTRSASCSRAASASSRRSTCCASSASPATWSTTTC